MPKVGIIDGLTAGNRTFSGPECAGEALGQQEINTWQLLRSELEAELQEKREDLQRFTTATSSTVILLVLILFKMYKLQLQLENKAQLWKHKNSDASEDEEHNLILSYLLTGKCTLKLT